MSDSLSNSEQSYSRLAWELARTGRYSSADDNGVRVAVDLSVETIYGEGRTTTDAMRNAAVNLDKWARRVEGSRS